MYKESRTFLRVPQRNKEVMAWCSKHIQKLKAPVFSATICGLISVQINAPLSYNVSLWTLAHLANFSTGWSTFIQLQYSNEVSIKKFLGLIGKQARSHKLAFEVSGFTTIRLFPLEACRNKMYSKPIQSVEHMTSRITTAIKSIDNGTIKCVEKCLC